MPTDEQHWEIIPTPVSEGQKEGPHCRAWWEVGLWRTAACRELLPKGIWSSLCVCEELLPEPSAVSADAESALCVRRFHIHRSGWLNPWMQNPWLLRDNCTATGRKRASEGRKTSTSSPSFQPPACAPCWLNPAGSQRAREPRNASL